MEKLKKNVKKRKKRDLNKKRKNVYYIYGLIGWFARNRHADPEARAYYQRDKTGSSSEWYPHVQGATPGGGGSEPQRGTVSSPRRSAGNAEADDIARRLKNESEDWYVYDGPGEGRRSPVSAAERAVSPEVRRMLVKATGDEMKHTLRMDWLEEQQPQTPLILFVGQQLVQLAA